MRQPEYSHTHTRIYQKQWRVLVVPSPRPLEKRYSVLPARLYFDVFVHISDDHNNNNNMKVSMWMYTLGSANMAVMLYNVHIILGIRAINTQVNVKTQRPARHRP